PLIEGPLSVGFGIDHGGFRAALARLALLPLIPVFVLATNRLELPGPHPAHKAHPLSHALDLIAHVELRRVFAINALISMAWEIHTIFVPIYGNSIGLSATMIGLILAAFANVTRSLSSSGDRRMLYEIWRPSAPPRPGNKVASRSARNNPDDSFPPDRTSRPHRFR